MPLFLRRPQREARPGSRTRKWDGSFVSRPVTYRRFAVSSAQFKGHPGARPSDATVIEPTDRAHETFQARSRCRTRPLLSQTLAFLHTLSPSWRTVYRFDTRSPRCDSRFCPLARFAIDKAFLFFFFFCITWPCLSFYDKLNFLFRTRQTKGFARFFFAVRSPFWEESCYLACKLRCIPVVNGTMCKFLSPGRSRDDREWVSVLRILRKLFYACE